MNLNFRTRVIVAAVAAAALAVVLSSASSYITTRDALLNSADQSLLQAAGPKEPGETQGGLFVLANGTVASGPSFFVDQTVRNFAKDNNNQRIFRTTDFSGQWFRELLVPATLDIEGSCDNAVCNSQRKGVEMFVVGFNGQISELRHLLRTLVLAAGIVMLLALSMGLWLTQNALRPLESVTNEIEEIAEENDVSKRIDNGGSDELGRLRRVFNKLLTSVDDSQALQRQLVLDASHELRTPLTSLRTNAQVLSRASELSPDDLQQLTTDMVTQVDELAALITDLGELARGERSEGQVVELRFDDVVADCVETARTYARIKNISIDFDAEPSFVDGRRDRLMRAVSNLLTNAIKFTPAGGHVTVVVTPGTLVVSDSGPGVAPDERARVFDRFWRAPSSRGLPGSGLGLSIVAQVVDEFDGTVTVDQDSVLGGARFTMTLPAH